MNEQKGKFVGMSRGLVVLVLCAVGILATWVLVLPAVGRVDVVRRDMDRLEAAGIDASALYWTELDDERLWERSVFERGRSMTSRLGPRGDAE